MGLEGMTRERNGSRTWGSSRPDLTADGEFESTQARAIRIEPLARHDSDIRRRVHCSS